jgi:hypothetical protein
MKMQALCQKPSLADEIPRVFQNNIMSLKCSSALSPSVIPPPDTAMNFFENLLENFREAPALTACVVFCAAAIFFLPDEGRIALLKNLSVGVFAIPLGIHIWRSSRLDHLDEGFPLFTTLIFLAGGAYLAVPALIDLHRPRVTVTTENFHVKTRFCRSSGHHYCYDSRYRLVLPEKHAELVLEKKRVRPLQSAHEIRVEYWPKSDIIYKIEILR